MLTHSKNYIILFPSNTHCFIPEENTHSGSNMVNQSRVYGLKNPLQKLFPQPIVSQRAPNSNDYNFAVGQVWVDKPNNDIYTLASVSAKSAVWVNSGSDSLEIDANGDVTISGDITATGDLTTTEGDLLIAGAGKGLRVKGGAVTDFIGIATLASGTATVLNTNIAATDRIFLSYVGTSIADSGNLSYAITAETSFVIESTNGSDANDVAYFIVKTL